MQKAADFSEIVSISQLARFSLVGSDMRFGEEARATTVQRGDVPSPLSLGFADCGALLLSALLMALAVLWPSRRKAIHNP